MNLNDRVALDLGRLVIRTHELAIQLEAAYAQIAELTPVSTTEPEADTPTPTAPRQENHAA